jgi:hypothetical protein
MYIYQSRLVNVIESHRVYGRIDRCARLTDLIINHSNDYMYMLLLKGRELLETFSF